MKYNMNDLEDQMFWGDGLPENIYLDDTKFSVNGVTIATVQKGQPVLLGAKFVSGGFKEVSDAILFQPGTIIDVEV